LGRHHHGISPALRNHIEALFDREFFTAVVKGHGSHRAEDFAAAAARVHMFAYFVNTVEVFAYMALSQVGLDLNHHYVFAVLHPNVSLSKAVSVGILKHKPPAFS
jgi:hypothetical protein